MGGRRGKIKGWGEPVERENHTDRGRPQGRCTQAWLKEQHRGHEGRQRGESGGSVLCKGMAAKTPALGNIEETGEFEDWRKASKGGMPAIVYLCTPKAGQKRK